MPNPQATSNLLIPHPQDWQGVQMPHSCLGGDGCSWNWRMHYTSPYVSLWLAVIGGFRSSLFQWEVVSWEDFVLRFLIVRIYTSGISIPLSLLKLSGSGLMWIANHCGTHGHAYSVDLIVWWRPAVSNGNFMIYNTSDHIVRQTIILFIAFTTINSDHLFFMTIKKYEWWQLKHQIHHTKYVMGQINASTMMTNTKINQKY